MMARKKEHSEVDDLIRQREEIDRKIIQIENQRQEKYKGNLFDLKRKLERVGLEVEDLTINGIQGRKRFGLLIRTSWAELLVKVLE